MVLTKAQAKSLDILEVARSLGMEMKRKSHREYYWAEHDSFKIDTVKNTWRWYSQADKYGDTIQLVQEMRNVSYKDAIVFLETGSFPEAKPVEEERKPFNYTLAPYEQPFVEARSYLKEIRGLSDDTIDFFLEKGVLAQAKRKDKDGVIEDVLVFKYLDRNQQLVGASLQGLVPDQERHPGKGYLKQIMYQSESISGLNVSIGSPKRLIVTEAPIDLMSYYELHKGELNDVRLVAMEGLKEGVLSHYVLEMLQERGEIAMDERDYTKSSELTRTSKFLSVAAETSTLFQDHKYDDLITLAVDRDKAGTDFITKLREKKIPVVDARPPKREGQEKTDWNEILKQEKQLEKDAPDNSRLAQARRKLERLRGEQDEAISRAYSHQAVTNGQPMNDKRGGASFMRRQEQIEGQVFSKMDEIRQQEERVERLEHQQHLKEMGLNRQGSGLEMSVQNIPRIREELEKAKRGESFFTKATLKRYQEELTRLEAISEQMGKTSIQPATQALIDEGLVNQWQKQPNTYFVKELRRVALELTEEGEFQLSSQIKYHPKTDEERLKVDELLAKQRQENVGLTPSNQEKSISPQPEPIEKNQGEAGWLEKNWDNLTFSIENKKTVVIDPTSIDKTVEEKQTPDNQESIELVWELHRKWEDELAEKIREDLGINHELQAWQFEKEMSRFITTDLDKLFAKRTRLERDAYFADSATSIRKEIDRLDAQILEYIEKAPEQSQERLNDRASGGEGYSQHDAVGSAEPEAELSATFEQTVASHPTSPYRYLHFSTTFEEVQRRQSKYHPITSDDLKRMNQYAGSIQKSSQWYLEELANSKIYYFYSNNGEVSLLDVNFKRENFLHLTGIRPVVPGRNAGDFVVDFAEGRGDYNQILVSNSLKEKLQVIPMLEDILDPKSFVLDNLDEVRIAQRLNFSEAIKSKDEDFLLLFKDIGDERVPASLMKIKRDLRVDVEKTKEKVILGVFRERDGHIEQLSINEDYVKDRGNELQTILKDGLFEEIKPDITKEIEQTTPENTLNSPLLDSATFTPYHLERLASELDISQFSYALEDTLYADQLLSQLPFGDLENSPIGFTDSSHDSRLGFISFDGMDSVEVENLSAWFEKLGVKDSPMEQLALIEKWQKEIKGLSEKVEQTISTVREEFEKSQEEEIKLEEQRYNKQKLEHDADADGVSDEEELLQGTNPYDFRSKPGSKPEGEESLQADEVVLAAGSLAVADFIQNKDMAGLSRHLKEGIKEFLDSDKYKDYLTKMSQLNNYSNRNLRLILAQNPEARQVASFKQWKENFGRYVKKGEKALRIFKPMTKIKKDENNQPILDKYGKPETVTFFGLVPVFDVSQTEGKEMPKAAEVKEQLTDLDYANLYRALMAIAKENDVSVRFEEMENNKHGYYSVPENQIVLRSNEMNKAQIIKTFLHEMAHAELHHADNPQKENLTRSTAELQAESVAYVVSSYYGIDTSEYSFNYLSGWSADKETLADLEAQLDIVQQEAKSLMVRMDQALEQLRLSQEKQTQRSFEQKLEKFKGQTQQAVEDHKQELKRDAPAKKEKGFSK